MRRQRTLWIPLTVFFLFTKGTIALLQITQSTIVLYLAPDLTITKIFELYCEKNSDELIREHVFRSIFKEYEPPLVIFQPKKDQCMVCNLTEHTGTTETDKKYKNHREQNRAIQAMKKSDKEHAKLKQETHLICKLSLPYLLMDKFITQGNYQCWILLFTIQENEE